MSVSKFTCSARHQHHVFQPQGPCLTKLSRRPFPAHAPTFFSSETRSYGPDQNTSSYLTKHTASRSPGPAGGDSGQRLC